MLDGLVEIIERYEPKFSAEEITRIKEIEGAVSGTRSELESLLKIIEEEIKNEWSLGRLPSWNKYEGTRFARVPEHNCGGFLIEGELDIIHLERLETVTEVIRGEAGVLLEDGGIKAIHRVIQKLTNRHRTHRPRQCSDLTRMRLVAVNLKKLEEAYKHISKKMPLNLVGIFNHYEESRTVYGNPFRGINTVWCGLNKEDPNDQVATEIQFVTQRVRDVGLIDHPFNLSGIVEYPDQESRDYVISLMLKASILDMQEFLNEYQNR